MVFILTSDASDSGCTKSGIAKITSNSCCTLLKQAVTIRKKCDKLHSTNSVLTFV